MITHHFGGGVYAKETRIPAGYVLGKHTHTFDHLSILASGVVQLTVDGESRSITGPACVVIEADKTHELKAVTNTVWYCVHATDCDDADKIDEVLIAQEA